VPADARLGIPFQSNLSAERHKRARRLRCLDQTKEGREHLKNPSNVALALGHPLERVNAAVPLDAAEAAERATQPVKNLRRHAGQAVLCGRRSNAIPVGAAGTTTCVRQTKTALAIEESGRPREIELFWTGVGTQWQTKQVEHLSLMAAATSKSGSRFVLHQEVFDRRIRLTPLDSAKMRPEQRDRGHRFEATARDPLVEVVVFRWSEPSKISHGMLKSGENQRHAIAGGLGHDHLEAQIARSRGVAVDKRAALAVK